MSIEVSEYVNVKERALKLECNVPAELAILPRNFESAEAKHELIHEDSAPTVRILLREAGLVETKIEKEGDKFPYAQEKAFQWIGPIIFVSPLLLSQNPYALSVAIGVISNYLTDWFKGVPGRKKVKLSIVVEQSTEHISKRIDYEGEIEGLKELLLIVQEVQSQWTPE